MRSLLIFSLCAFLCTGIIAAPRQKRHIKPNSNPDERGHYFESDIRLHQLMNPHADAIDWRWEDGIIPYDFSEGQHSPVDQNIIFSAMAEISALTCIKFVPRTTESDYLSIVNNPTGCWSYVGRIRGAQELNLQSSSGCVSKGVSMHELVHAIGFWHSQSDLKRDQYVKVEYENMDDYAVGNFAAYTNNYVTDYGHGYDYGSILHYSMMSFSKNGLPTLVPLQSYSGVIGQRDRLSDRDVAKINAKYNCPPKIKFDFGKLA